MSLSCFLLKGKKRKNYENYEKFVNLQVKDSRQMNETIFEFFPPRLRLYARQDETGRTHRDEKRRRKKFSSLHFFYGDEREDAELKKNEEIILKTQEMK